jgi:hypothetical protein
VHWADDATLDALAYAARRIERVPAVLLLTFRDEQQPALAAPARRRRRRAPSPAGARAAQPRRGAALSAGRGADGAALHRITGGNPFFVSEVLASPPGRVPASVADAVLARVSRLSDDCRAALDQLSVMPFAAGAGLLGTGWRRWPRPRRRASWSAARRASPSGTRSRAARSSRACRRCAGGCSTRRWWPRCGRRALDLARLMHHAAEAGDVATILEFGLARGA